MPPSDEDALADAAGEDDDAAAEEDEDEQPVATTAATPRHAIPMRCRDLATQVIPPVVTVGLRKRSADLCGIQEGTEGLLG
jgi:hypothetical protein